MVSSMATRGLLAALAARFQQQTSRAVTTEAAGGVDVAKRVEAGEAVDVVVLASNAIDKLIASGRLYPGRVDVVQSGIAMAVRKGASLPAIATEEDVKRAVLDAESVSYSTGPSGQYLESLFSRWGIMEKVRPRIVVPPPGIPVGSLVAEGKVALGFQQLSELANLKGVTVLGLLPESIQSMTVFSGGVSTGSDSPDAARALLAFLAAPGVSELKKQHGMSAA
jgi:molybdate transport system substrate-binding protein